MFKYRQILPLLLIVVLTGCNGAWKPKWMSRLRPKSEDRRTATVQDEVRNVTQEDQLAAETEVEQESTDAELAAVERQTRLIRDAQTALRSEQIEEARRLYQQVLNDAPDHPDAHHGLAMAADLKEDWGDAEYHYKQALRIRPRDAVLLSDIGYSYVLQNRYSEAARYLNQAIELQPSYERAHMNLALLDIRQGNRTAAEQRLVQRLGNSAKTRGILASLEQQAFPDSSVAAAPRPENRQPDSDMTPEQVQEKARRERALAEQQRNERTSDRRTPEPWFRENPQPAGTPASTVSDSEFQSQRGEDAYGPIAQTPPMAAYPSNMYPTNSYTNPGYPSSGYADASSPEMGSTNNNYPNPGYASGGYPNSGYSDRGYPGGGQPNGGYPMSGYQARNYPAAGYPSYPAPGAQQSDYPAPGYGYPAAGYPPQQYESEGYPVAGDPSLEGPPPSYSAAGRQPEVPPSAEERVSAGQPDSTDRPSGKLALSGPASAGRSRPPLSEAPAGDASWSSSNAQNPGSVAVTPPVPIRSSATGTTVGAESYGQPAGFNRGLPGRMRVSESGNGQSGFPTYGTGASFRTEGLNIGPGSLFPAVEPPRSTLPPQRTVIPAGYGETGQQGGVIPAWARASDVRMDRQLDSRPKLMLPQPRQAIPVPGRQLPPGEERVTRASGKWPLRRFRNSSPQIVLCKRIVTKCSRSMRNLIASHRLRITMTADADQF
ncbi:MAG UNVERIFIED_CONTAM: tetratricopeptide repeat protein [Planctomycetaceae bacterium]|jgi:Flp pilus assembly protein TadD